MRAELLKKRQAKLPAAAAAVAQAPPAAKKSRVEPIAKASNVGTTTAVAGAEMTVIDEVREGAAVSKHVVTGAVEGSVILGIPDSSSSSSGGGSGTMEVEKGAGGGPPVAEAKEPPPSPDSPRYTRTGKKSTITLCALTFFVPSVHPFIHPQI